MKQGEGLRGIHSKRLPDIIIAILGSLKESGLRHLEQVWEFVSFIAIRWSLNYVRVARNNDVPWPRQHFNNYGIFEKSL